MADEGPERLGAALVVAPQPTIALSAEHVVAEGSQPIATTAPTSSLNSASADRARADARLTESEIRERLRISSPGLIEEVHAFVLRQGQAEEQRETRLDGKATTLATAAGISVTVVFSVGLFLLEKINVLRNLGSFLGHGVLALYALALVFVLLAGAWSIRALRIRNTYRCVTDNDVFNEVEFARIERASGDHEKRAQAEYRRYLLPQQWIFFREHQRIHTQKADLISRGQWFFASFIVTLLVLGAVITLAAFLQFGSTGGAGP